MDLFIYSDESGVFDKVHNDYFVFGGLLFLSKDDKDDCLRKYLSVERRIKDTRHYDKSKELKASHISNTDKKKIYNSLIKCYKFGVIINQNQVHNRIFENKKSRQRYLDFAYKIAVKNCLLSLIKRDVINKVEQINIHFFIDEHTTATNGRYELKESLEREFKIGTINFEYNTFHPPIFENLQILDLKFYDSKSQALIRAADIVANNIFHKAIKNDDTDFVFDENFFIKYLP